MGTNVSSSNEWIELSNSGTEQVSLEGWILSIEGKKDIALVGNISAGGFYLVERTDDSTVPTVAADVVSSFGAGINNTGAIISLKNTSGAIVDRVDGSQGWLIGGNQAGDNTTKDTAQKGLSAWMTGTPTPRGANVGASSQTQTTVTTQETPQVVAASQSSAFPVEPQIFTDAGPAALIVSTGATVTFLGRVWGLKKEPIENARMVWAFGDGGVAEGASVSHVFYYPGEYTVVLDAASGFYAASDRIRVTAITPNILLRTGGDSTRSFVALENKGNDELDLSLWQIESAGKKFIIPKNTFVGAKKILTLASEVTNLVTPSGSEVLLNFPNGTRVGAQATAAAPVLATNTFAPKINSVVPQAREKVEGVHSQEASVIGALSDSSAPGKEDGLWLWYSSAAILGALALLGLRAVQGSGEKTTFTADDFEIIEETDNTEPH
ncbi:MAG: lamin tail domain-containing protein [Candidatus Pacebacteria bacterium]|nr:lamin tail domain-containing protein [Candidatus Paceibacterota bacterium]